MTEVLSRLTSSPKSSSSRTASPDRRTVAPSADDDDPHGGGVDGGASVGQLTMNMTKIIVGFGVLTLPTGMERLSDNGLSSSQALHLSLALILVFGALNAWTFVLIGKACEETDARSYTEAWDKTLGRRTGWVVTFASIMICFNTAVICQSVIAHTMTDLVAFTSGVPFEELPRRTIQLAITLAVLTPLCMLPSLKPLAFTSTFGVIGTTATAMAFVFRLLDRSYEPEGEYFEVVQWTPSFSESAAENKGLTELLSVAPSGSSVAFLLSLVSSAYLAHFNAPLLYMESQPNAIGSKLPAFRTATINAFCVATALFLSIGGAGFATFGEAVQALIINNYASADPFAALARFGIFLTVLFEFPLLERPWRLNVAEVLGRSNGGRGTTDVLLSVLVVSVVSLADPPLDQLAALGGATGGVLLIYVAPALMSLELLRRKADDGIGARVSAASLRCLAAMGLILSAVGTYVAIGERPEDSNPPVELEAGGQSRPRASRLLVCGLPARRLPARVTDVWNGNDPTDRGAIFIGGCSANYSDEHGGTLTLVLGMVRTSEHDFLRRDPVRSSGAGTKDHHFHRSSFRHNLSWVESLGLVVSLEGVHCNMSVYDTSALAACSLHPSHLDVVDMREHSKLGHRDVVITNHGAHASLRSTAVVRLFLEPSTRLQENDGTRSVVWTSAALFEPPCHHLVWHRLGTWAASWRAAGFQDIVLHARDASLCADLQLHLPGVICVPTPSQPGNFPDVPKPADHLRDYLDQALLNMVGLVQARAAGYRMIAFVDTDELPPKSTDEMKESLDAMLQSGRPFASFFFRAGLCAACPKSPAELADAVRTGRCKSTESSHGQMLDSVTKVIGVPSRMTTMKIFSAEPAQGRLFAGCLQHPITPFEREVACHQSNRTGLQRRLKESVRGTVLHRVTSQTSPLVQRLGQKRARRRQ